MSDSNLDYMKKALAVARNCLEDVNRHPFGAIVVKNDKVVGVGMEATRIKNDPTAHSEIEAIRDACKNLMTDTLKGCVLYTSSEPCSMCLSALIWSQIDVVYYGCSREDVFQFGFSDGFKLVKKREDLENLNPKGIKLIQLKSPEASQVFKDWNKANKKTLKVL